MPVPLCLASGKNPHKEPGLLEKKTGSVKTTSMTTKKMVLLPCKRPSCFVLRLLGDRVPPNPGDQGLSHRVPCGALLMRVLFINQFASTIMAICHGLSPNII